MKIGDAVTIGLLAAAPAVATAHAAWAAPLQTGPVQTGPLNEAGAVVAPALKSEALSFEVFLPLRNESELDQLIKAQAEPGSASYHQWLSPAQFAERFGPSAASMAAARAALVAAGLTPTGAHSRSLTVLGTVGAVEAAFRVQLKSVTSRTGARSLITPSALTLPPALKAQGATVPAFANLPRLQVQSRRIPGAIPANRSSATGGYYFTDLRQAYDYPALNATLSNGQRLDGTGVSVAVVMSSIALNSDVAAAFNHENYTKVSRRAAPTFTTTNVDGGCNSVSCDAFGEASLDIQQVLGGAPGAKVSLINIPSLSDNYITDAYLYIVEQNKYDVVSSSFGGCELNYTAAYNGGVDYTGILRTYDGLFKQGNAQGITFIASSGDQGGLACPSVGYFSYQSASFIPSVAFPANDPAVTGVGGGNLVTTAPPNPQTNPPTLTSKYVAENANGDPEVPYDPYGLGVGVTGGYWGAGGGPSTVFSAPAYQLKVSTGSSARTVPDVGMQVGGCPGGIAVTPCGPQRSFVVVYVNGAPTGLIGTSVAAPEFAGAAALYVQRHGRQGNLNTFLYQQAALQNANSALGYYNRNIPGFDGKWTDAFPKGGYTYLVGNGTPRVRHLFGFLDVPAAGDPQTASNP